MRLTRSLLVAVTFTLAASSAVVLAQSGAPGAPGRPGRGADGAPGAPGGQDNGDMPRGSGGQGGGGAAGGAAGGADANGGGNATPPGIIAALVNLQMELNALNTMNDASSQQLEGANGRIELMTKFVSSKSLDGDLATFKQNWKPTSAPLSFQQAYQTALQAEQLRGGVSPSTNDIDVLSREVAATTTMVHQQWNTLNTTRNQVQVLTQFLNEKKLMDAYHDFAVQNAKTLQAQRDAKADKEAQMEKARDAKEQAARNAALAYLQRQWDAQSHAASSGTNYDYGFSQGASQAGPFSQTPSKAYTAGTGETPPVYPVDPYPGVFDYWTGTYFNGYADPYYDVYGMPAAAIGGGRTAAGAYQRMADSSSPFRR